MKMIINIGIEYVKPKLKGDIKISNVFKIIRYLDWEWMLKFIIAIKNKLINQAILQNCEILGKIFGENNNNNIIICRG